MITRSEAIKQLRLLKADIINGLAFISKTKDKHPALESLDMAIKSLETDEAYQLEYESTTKNSLAVDAVAVSRQALIDWLKNWTLGDASPLIDFVNSMPPVTPIRPKGHWIGHREHCENLGVIPSGLGAYEWCSNCDCGIDVREWHRNHYNFCPNCGSDMREVEE